MFARILIPLCLLAGVLTPGVGLAPAQNDSIKWLNSYHEAVRQARQTGRPILVEFRCEA